MHKEKDIKAMRSFLMDTIRLRTDFSRTDQNKGVPMPPVQKELKAGEEIIPLPQWQGKVKPGGSLDEVIAGRKSIRKYLPLPLRAEELSYLLWATQGVRTKVPGRVLRTVPSAGNRQSIETYLAVTREITDDQGKVLYKRGLWRYMPLEHGLVHLGSPEPLEELVSRAALDQEFVGRAPVTFMWSTIPYRTEWRYSEASHKVIALDAGHVCQNLYLAAGSIGCGTCAIAAYHQESADELLQLSNPDEFVIYMAPVGKMSVVEAAED